MIRHFSTIGLAPQQRVPRWERWNRDALIGLSCQTPDREGLRGDEINLAMPRIEVARVRAAAHRVSRTPAAIEASPSGSVVAYLAVHGRATFAGTGLRPGQAIIVDADRPFERGFGTPFAELALKIPHETYAERHGTPPPRPVFAQVNGVAAVRARVLAAALAAWSDDPAGLPDEADMQAVALDLIDDLIGCLAVGSAGGDRLSLARALVEQHLSDPSFSAGMLAALLGISERQVSRLFASAGTTVPRYVNERRLTRASALLAQGSRPIAEVARRSGYSSAPYFDRVFRAHFGMTPRQAQIT